MTPSFRALLFCLPLLGGLAHGATPDGWLGKSDCRIAALHPRPAHDAVAWSGACKDGHADGKGVLAWRVEGKGQRRLEATLVGGEISGEGTLATNEGKYI